MIIDFHTHILPSVDDGSKSVEISMAMLKSEAEQGIKKVILTPHFYATHDSPERFIKRINHSRENLLQSLNSDFQWPEISLGSEIHFFEGISDCEFLKDMAIENTNCVLVEMPMRKWTDRMLLELEGIRQKRKLVPIIAHIDRYMTPFKTNGVVEQLSDLPVKIQANADFFINFWSKKLALKLMSEGKIHFLGSDCHNMKDRKPNLGDALAVIRKQLGDSAIEFINFNENKFLTKINL